MHASEQIAAGLDRPLPHPRDILRGATQEAHEAGERAFAGFSLGERSGYADFLRAQAGAVVAAETAAERAGIVAILPDWALRRRGAAVLADCADLGAKPLGGLTLPARTDALGIAYVLEGSRHGARLLLKRLRTADDPALAGATRFLGQPFDGARWRALLDAVNARGRDPAALAAMVEGASATFALFEAAATRVLAGSVRPAGALEAPAP